MSRDFKATTLCSPKLSMFVTLPFMALRKEFIKCEATLSDDTLKNLIYHVDYDISGSVITFNEDTMEDVQMIRVYRETPTEYLLTQYVDSSVLKAYDMNVRDVQMLHVLEEAYDYVLWYGMLFDYNSQTWNAKMGRICSVGTPTDITDATNKRYVDDADNEIKQYIQDYCLLFDEDMDAWDARNKSIAKVAEPTKDTDATTKRYVDTKIQALREYVEEIRDALQSAIDALATRMTTAEQAIEDLTTRMGTAEANIVFIQQVLTQHTAQILAHTQVINSNTAAIEALQAAMTQVQYTLEHLPSGGGGGGSIEDIEELKQEIIDSLYVSVAKPTIVSINHHEPQYDWEQESWQVELSSYNYEAMSMQGDQYTNNPGWHTIIFTLKPLYKWEDGTTEPYELRWYAETNRQVISLDRVVTDGPNADCKGTMEMNDLAGNIGYQWNGDASSPATAPIKTFYFNFTQPYTKLCTEGMGQTHEEGDTFYFNASDENGDQQPIYKITVGHDWVKIEGNGYNSGSSESINVICDNDMNSRFVINFTANGWVQEEEVPKITLESIEAGNYTHTGQDISLAITSYTTKMDKKANIWYRIPRQKLNFAFAEPYTTLKVKDNTTGVVATEDGNTQLDVVQNYQGDSVPRMIVTVDHTSVTIVALGYNSDVSKSFTVYTDDDEEHGYVVTITETLNFPEMISTDSTPYLDTTGYKNTYTDNDTGIRYTYQRMYRLSPSNSDLAELIANGSFTYGNFIVQGDFLVNEKSDSGDYTFTLTPVEGYVWAFDLSRTPKSFTWTHERTRDNVARPTLTLLSEHKTFAGSTPKLYYGGNDLVLQYETESDGELEVIVPDNSTYPRNPEYEVDTVNKTITVRLTKPSKYLLKEEPDEYENLTTSYSSLQTYSGTGSYIRVRTLQSARCNASQTTDFSVRFEAGGWVEYEHRLTSLNAAHLKANGAPTYLSVSCNDCTYTEATRQATTVGTHYLEATLKDDAEAWWDGSTERTRQFPWVVQKASPISPQWTNDVLGSYPSYGYNATGIISVSRGDVISPAPTVSVLPAEYADAVEITPAEEWGSNPWQRYIVRAKADHEFNKSLYAKLTIPEGENSAAQVYALFISTGQKGKETAGDLSSFISSSMYLEDGAKIDRTAINISHGEISSIDDIQITVEDESILTVEKSEFRRFYADQYPGVSTQYYCTLTITPKAVGSTNVNITIPETEHYRMLTRIHPVQVKNKS